MEHRGSCTCHLALPLLAHPWKQAHVLTAPTVLGGGSSGRWGTGEGVLRCSRVTGEHWGSLRRSVLRINIEHSHWLADLIKTTMGATHRTKDLSHTLCSGLWQGKWPPSTPTTLCKPIWHSGLTVWLLHGCTERGRQWLVVEVDQCRHTLALGLWVNRRPLRTTIAHYSTN